jgi:hypothetical protein
MSKMQILRSRPGLFGGLGKTLATGLTMYRGWHS